MSSTPPVSGSSLAGHLDLTCSVRPDGISSISKQNFRAPIHIGKGHHDQGKLILNITNPTAGFFDGDRVDSQIRITPDAHLVLSTPAASRVYQSRSGKPAANHQRFDVGKNASLEWNPEAFIPHAGASYIQTTKIDLHRDADLLFFEWLAPGRVAMGEIFAYQSLRWELDLSVDGELVARERYHLQPGGHSLETLRAPFPAAHYLSVYIAGTMTRDWPTSGLDTLNSDDTRLGHGPLPCGVHVIRALCRDSLASRRLLDQLRHLLHTGAGLTPPNLGRIFS